MCAQDLKLWYRGPAEKWVNALPVGNGKLGAMVFGRVAEERIQINEDSLWYGGPKKREQPDAHKHLEEIRRLMFAGRPEEAEHLARMALTPDGLRTEAVTQDGVEHGSSTSGQDCMMVRGPMPI